MSVKKILYVLFPLMLLVAGNHVFAYDLVVAKDGTGNYTTIQAAINAAPSNANAPFTIYIKSGTYFGKLTITKPFIKLIGESVAKVIITASDFNGKFNPATGGTLGGTQAATVIVNAPDFTAINITFENTTGDSPQAPAINVNGTRAAFMNCRFLGGQDTMYTNNDGSSQYYRNCYIEGVVDFIFGGAKCVFDSCIIYPKTRMTGGGGGFVTAASTPAGQAYGYVFRNCKLMNNFGGTTYYLGRPWNNATGSNNPPAQNKVVWLNTSMATSILPAGWVVWDAGTVTSVIYFAEYKSRRFNGTLVDTSQRVSWSHQLNDMDAATYYVNSNIFGSWDPCAVLDCNNGFSASIAISNFRATAGTGQSTIQWNQDWPIPQVKFELYRSKDSQTYNKIYETTSVSDTLFNFTTNDTLPQTGGTWFYYIKATQNGLTALFTDTIRLTIPSNIKIANALGGFLQGVGTPSPAQTYTVSGTSLSGGITITAPAGYELSADGGLSWNNSNSPVILAASGGTVAPASIQVRLNATTAGTYNGAIAHVTPGHALVSQPVKGTAQATAIPPDTVLIYWPYTTNNNDSAAMRISYVAPGKDSLYRFSLSNGSTITTVPAYSPVFGKALSANNSGNGTWPAAFAVLNNTCFNQLDVTPLQGSGLGLRVTSLQLSASMYRSTTGKLALSYSLDNFVSDSNSFTYALNGSTALPITASGGFNTPLLLPGDTLGVSTGYTLQFSGSAGVIVPPGSKLSVRLYFASTNGTGYYARLKDVSLRGNAYNWSNVSVSRVEQKTGSLIVYPNPAQQTITASYPAAGKKAFMHVHNMSGAVVFSQVLQEASTRVTVNISSLSPGVYMLGIVDGTAKEVTEFIIR